MSNTDTTTVPDDQNLILNLDEPPPEPVPSPASVPPVQAGEGDKPPPVPGPSKTPPAMPQVGLVELERQVEAERRERARVMEAARQLAYERDQAMVYAQQAAGREATSYEQQVDNHLANGQQQIDALTSQYETALSNDDFKEAAEIQRTMNRIAVDMAVQEEKRAAWRQQVEYQRAAMQQRRPQPQQAREQAPADPFERAIRGRTKPTQDFLRKHTDLVRSDGTLKRIAIDAHDKALDAGHEIDTEAYFQHIEQTLGANGASTADGGNAPTRMQGAPTMAAPISRSAGPGGGGSGTFVMTPKMRRLAEEQGVTPHEWATNYLRLVKEGRMTPIT